MNASLGLEDQLLLAAAHPVLSEPRAARLASLFEAGVHWPAVIERADRHGVAPLVYGHLRTLGATSVPADVYHTFAALAHACVAFNLCLRHELDGLLAAFARAGIPVMPLKGPVLADQLYPAPLLRPSGDLDLLVQAHHAAAACRVLAGLEYTCRPEDEQGAEYHAIFTRDGIDVELHVDVGEAHVSRLDLQSIWSSAIRGSWHGHPIWLMTVPHQLLYLAFHAVKDGLASVKTLADITRLVEQHGDTLAWPALVPGVHAAHLSPVIYLALRESRDFLGAPVPDDFLDALRPRSAGWALAERLFRWRGGVLHVPDELLVGPFMAGLMLLWEETARGRLRHLRRNVLPSERLRRRWTSAPAPVSWLIWYALCLTHAARSLIRQCSVRASGHSARS